MKVTKDTTLDKILKDPKKRRTLEKFGVPCLFCPLAAYEIGILKIDDIAKAYGINLKKLLKALNE